MVASRQRATYILFRNDLADLSSRSPPSLRIARRLLRWGGSGDYIRLGALDDVDQLLLLGRGHLELRQARAEVDQQRLPLLLGDVEVLVGSLHVEAGVFAGTSGDGADEVRDVRLETCFPNVFPRLDATPRSLGRMTCG